MFRRPRSPHAGARPNPARPAGPGRRPARLECTRLEDRATPVIGAFAIPNPVAAPSPYDGVADLVGGTGSLLFDGRHILTAGHVAEDFGTYPHVIFNMPGGRIDIPNQGAGIRYAPGWDGWHNDMAVFPLTDPEEPSPARQLVAPLGAQRYQIFRGSGEVGRQFTFVGYGGTGTGATGWQYSEEPAPRRVGSNRFDDDWTLFHQGGPVNLPQYAAPGSALLFDFDDGSSGHDFFGHFFGRPDTGLGAAESMFYRGDSGGPAFLDGQVAGVGWIFGSVHGSGQDTDVDGTTDGSFGEFSSYVRTGSYQGFIDSAVSGRYTLVFDMNYQPQQVGGVNGGRNILTVQRSGDHLQLNYNGTTDTAVYRIADIDALVIRGSDRDDAVNLEDLAGVLPGGVSFDGRGGQNTLYVLDTIGSTFRPTSAHAGTIDGGVTYQNVDELIGSGTAHTLTLAGLAGGVTAAVQANYYGNDPGGLQAAYATATITTPDGLSLHVQGLDTFVGTPGFDRLTGPDQGTWTIDGPGAGHLSLPEYIDFAPTGERQVLAFTGFEGISSGGTIAVKRGASLAGGFDFDGGTAGVTLDLSDLGPLDVRVTAPGAHTGFDGTAATPAGPVRFADVLAFADTGAAGDVVASDLTVPASWEFLPNGFNPGGGYTYGWSLAVGNQFIRFGEVEHVTGGPGPDDFLVEFDQRAELTVDGGPPDAAPGDKFTIARPSGTPLPQLRATGRGAGQWTLPPYQPVNISGFESLGYSPVAGLALDGLPAEVTAGRPVTVTVRAIDLFGATVAGFGGAVALDPGDPSAAAPSSVYLSGGTGEFTVTFGTPGTFALSASDSGQPPLTGRRTVAVVAPPTIADTPPPAGRVGEPYSFAFALTAGGPAAFALAAGDLPPGLALTPEGELTGVPAAAGTYAFTVVATDGAGAAGSGTYSLTVEPPPTPVALTPPDLPTGLVGTFYLQPITASGPPGSFFTFAVGSGSLPPGLTLAMSDSQSAMLIGTPAAAGSFDFTVTATDGVSEVGTQPYTLTVYPAAGGGGGDGGGGGGGSGGPGPMLIVSGSPDGSAVVYTAGAAGALRPAGTPVAVFPGFAGEVRAATGDFDGDGVMDTVLVTGPGVKTQMAVVSGKDGSTLLAPTDPFGDANFTSGGFVAAGDIDRDGKAEWVVTPELRGGPRVVIFRLLPDGSFDITSPGQPSLVANFFGIGDPAFRDGDRVALGDVNGDGVLDVFSIAAFNGGPRTALYDGRDVLGARAANRDPVKLVGDFFAAPSGTDEGRGGRSIAAGDVNGDGVADLIVTGDNLLGTGNQVVVFSGADLLAGRFPGVGANPIADFAVAGMSPSALVSVAAVDADADGRADVAVGSGAGQPSLVMLYRGQDLAGTTEPPSASLDPFGAATADGVFVG